MRKYLLPCLLVLLVASFLFETSDSASWRRIRRWRAREHLRRVRLGKKSITTAETFPCDFKKWDANADGAVDLEEFFLQTKQYAVERELEELFQLSDKDDDQKLSEKELSGAPLNFEKC